MTDDKREKTSIARGVIALIGSGEFSGTMVETHKKLLSRQGAKGKTLFLDTPAGFQENADLLAHRAVEYFEQHVCSSMEVASFKAAESATLEETQKVFHLLSEGGFVLIGPGSPTYTVRQLKNTPIPLLLSALVTKGGCLVAASAAALAAGSRTLPVYEIYKVGEKLHWVEGLNILGQLGLDLVVVPHWNNAEGGNHDTRFCFMGEKRFSALEAQLPPGTVILGIDEHTACILDFSTREALVEGLGQVTIRSCGLEQRFGRGERITFDQLSGAFAVSSKITITATSADPLLSSGTAAESVTPFWDQMLKIEKAFHHSLKQKDWAAVARLLLEADKLLSQPQPAPGNPELVSQGRELYRRMIVLAVVGIDQISTNSTPKFRELVNKLVGLREQYRRTKRWKEADELRSLLQDAGVTLQDAPEGPG